VEINTAKRIGQRLAIKSGLIGLLIAYVLFAWVTYSWDEKLSKAAFWIFDVEFWYHLVIGAIGLLTMAYFFGQLAESLSRYDAKSLHSKKPTVTEIKSQSGMLLGILEDAKGNICFGSGGGVYRYDGKTITDFKSKEVQK